MRSPLVPIASILLVLAGPAVFSHLGVFSVAAWGQSSSRGLIARSTALHHGLQRSWFTQVHLDPSRGRVTHMTLHRGTLFVQTDRAVVHAIDAENGQTLWAAGVGDPRHPSLPLGANDDFVAVANGSNLFIVKRSSGDIMRKVRIGGAPGAGLALTSKHVLVPLVNGLIESHGLARQEALPWFFHSGGRASVPVVSAQSILWATDRGQLYLGDAEPLGVRRQFEMRGAVRSPITFGDEFVYAATLEGYVYAVREKDGQEVWQFSCGRAVREPLASVDGRLYVCPDRDGMVCLAGDSGDFQWRTPHVKRFLAATPDRVYGIGPFGSLVITSSESGALIGRISTPELTVHLANQESDRIYLATSTGLLQCLHETGLTEPADYRPVSAEPAEASAADDSDVEGDPNAETVEVPAPEGA